MKTPARASGHVVHDRASTASEGTLPVSVMDQLQDLEATVAKRMAELKPLVDEYAELEQVAQRLGVKPAAAATTSAATRSRSRSRRAGRKSSSNGAGAAS